jgi:hypothetical protein
MFFEIKIPIVGQPKLAWKQSRITAEQEYFYFSTLGIVVSTYLKRPQLMRLSHFSLSFLKLSHP